MNYKSNHILVTDGYYKHTLSAVRSLARAGYLVDVIGYRNCLARWSRFLSSVAYPQELFNDKHIGRFIRFIECSRYDVLLPIGARSVQLIARHREVIEKYCLIPLPSKEAIELCLDKEKTNNFVDTLDIKVPRTWSYKSISELKANIEEIVFPVAVKGKSEIFKDPPFYAKNAKQLLERIMNWGNNNYYEKMPFPIVQQYINGVGVGFFALYQNGQCRRVFMHRRLRETPPSGGASSCAISIYENDLLRTGKKILDALEWHGVAMVEFKREINTGDLYLMEVNPKFWGSLDLAIACGVDFPTLDVRMVSGGQLSYSDKYKIGLKYHWPLNGELSHIKENPKSFFSVLKDFLDPGVKSNLNVNDPLPAFYSIYYGFRSIFVWMLTKMGLRKMISRIKNQGFLTVFVRAYTEGTGVPIVKYSRITPQIYIGAQHNHVGKRKLNRLGISAVVNLRDEFDDKQHNLVLGDYCYLPTVEFTAPEISQLQEGILFIRRIVENGRKVYIHCSEGISRSPTLVVAYFISGGMSLDNAIILIKKSRPFINILPVQMNRLKDFLSIVGEYKI